MYQQDENEDPMYHVVVKSQHEATLTVTHRCGHVKHYRFDGEELAIKGAESLLGEVCPDCANAAKVAVLVVAK